MLKVHEMLFDELKKEGYIERVGDVYKLTDKGMMYVDSFEKHLHRKGIRKFKLLGTFDEETHERRYCFSVILLIAGRPSVIPYIKTETNESNEKALEALG